MSDTVELAVETPTLPLRRNLRAKKRDGEGKVKGRGKTRREREWIDFLAANTHSLLILFRRSVLLPINGSSTPVAGSNRLLSRNMIIINGFASHPWRNDRE